MPKAPRANGSSTPKKRTKKTATEAAIQAGQPVPTTLESAVKAQPTLSLEERIRMRAYELYLQRNGNGGTPEQDWLQAKQEISGQQGVS